MMSRLFRGLFNRRARWLKEGLSASQRRLLAGCLPHWPLLSQGAQEQLAGCVRVLLEEKTFEACGGMVLEEHMKLSIAGFASLMLLGRSSDFFPDLRSILLYPSAYIAPVEEYDEAGLLIIGEEQRFGESWESGSMVLAWDEIRRHQQTCSADNLVIHECAHQIDDELQISLEIERVLNGKAGPEWAAILAGAYRRFSVAPQKLPLVDPYGAEHHSEFFAVLSEVFFTRSGALLQQTPALYEALAHIYQYRPDFNLCTARS